MSMSLKSSDRPEVDLLALIADDQGMISYRPSWNKFTGSINATILLQQVVYRWAKHGRQPFYKFSAPCAQLAYRPGDSWQEELGMSRKELENAKRKIAVSTKGELDDSALVSYWRDRYHKTWYALNELMLMELLGKIYPSNQEKNVGIQASLNMVNDEIPMHQTGSGTDAQKVHGPMSKRGIRANALMGSGLMHQRDGGTNALNGPELMHETGIGTDAQNVRPYSRENNKENNRDYDKDNSNKNAPVFGDLAGNAAAVAASDADQILDWMGFNGRLTKKDGDPPPDVLLAWGYWVRVEEAGLAAKGKNAVGIARAGWRRGDAPGGGWTMLARVWLELEDVGRWDLIDAGHEAKYSGGLVLTRGLEDAGLTQPVLEAFGKLWDATGGDVAPVGLMPVEELGG